MTMRIASLCGLLAATLLFAACDDEDGTTAPPKQTPYEWSLDLDLAGDASFKALKADTAVHEQFEYRGLIAGKVNGYDTALAADSLDFLNVEYEDFHVRAPLSADGAFSFEEFDLLGNLDGSMTLKIWLRGKQANRPPKPDTLVVEIGRILEFARL
jgi:hypothetical protein